MWEPQEKKKEKIEKGNGKRGDGRRRVRGENGECSKEKAKRHSVCD